MKPNVNTWMAIVMGAFGVLSAHAEQEIITKTFTVEPGGRLVMDVDRGSIRILTSDDSYKVEVKITRELRKGSAAEAKQVFEQHKIEFSATAQEVKIHASNPRQFAGFNSLFNRLQVDYAMTIPARFDVDLKTAGGHIDVTDLQGKADVRTAGGNLTLATIKGPLNARTAGGHISVRKVEGDANLKTDGGNVNAGEVGGNLVAKTLGGHITLDKIAGSVDASTSGGNIEVKSAKGTVNARTSGGHVSARLDGQSKEDCSLKTMGGNVELLLAADLRFNLSASTGGGRVSSEFPGEFNKQKTRLTAQINGGGPAFVLETAGGNVTVRKD